MTVVLTPRFDPDVIGQRGWLAIADQRGDELPLASQRLAVDLQAAFTRIVPRWLDLARQLGGAPSARLAHTPSAAGTVSDLGQMLAWTDLIDSLAAAPAESVVVCADPWMFRHLASRPGIRAVSAAPALHGKVFRLACRGLAARLAVSVRLARTAWALRHQRQQVRPHQPALLVYGHPASRTDGFDAYFGSLLQSLPDLTRLLHVDCPQSRALSLADGGRTLSLHGFGSVLTALGLWRHRWRPTVSGPESWLIHRAAALEGSGGQAAVVAWQIHCQNRWLEIARPSLVAWPWENHGWERALVTACHHLGVATLGYQHATIGQLEHNHGAGSLSEPQHQLPDRVSCSSPAFRDRLQHWGIPAERLEIGGSWRFQPLDRLPYDPRGPIFVAMPTQTGIAHQILAAIRPLAAKGWRFLLREHPMTPLGLNGEVNIALSPGPLGQAGPLRAVLYASTTVGLEALLAGLPVVRFQPQGMVANDVIPSHVPVATATAASLETTLTQVTPLAELRAEDFLCPARLEQWRPWFEARP